MMAIGSTNTVICVNLKDFCIFPCGILRPREPELASQRAPRYAPENAKEPRKTHVPQLRHSSPAFHVAQMSWNSLQCSDVKHHSASCFQSHHYNSKHPDSMAGLRTQMSKCGLSDSRLRSRGLEFETTTTLQSPDCRDTWN